MLSSQPQWPISRPLLESMAFPLATSITNCAELHLMSNSTQTTLTLRKTNTFSSGPSSPGTSQAPIQSHCGLMAGQAQAPQVACSMVRLLSIIRKTHPSDFVIELSPCRVNKDLTLDADPYSWNKVSKVLFLSQPVGVGFSYGSKVRSNVLIYCMD